MAALSEGYSIAPGAWAIPLSALPNLTITVPVTTARRSELLITLVSIDGAVLAETKSTLVIETPASVTAAQPAAPRTSPLTVFRAGSPPADAPAEERGGSPAPSSPAPRLLLSPQERERALRLLRKGEEELAEGRIAPARLLYERAANLGLAEAAMALAATYDAAELARSNLRAVQPDPKEARRWYERARQLGANGVEARLQRLGAN